MKKPVGPLDPVRIKTYSATDRRSLVDLDSQAKAWQAGGTFGAFLDGLPDTLAARDLKEIAGRIVQARKAGRPVIVAMGAHMIKVGLSPLLIDLIEREIVTGLAMNGSCVIHDLELAMIGRTSEDVAQSLDDGSFGMARETAEALNAAIGRCAGEDIGIGLAAGQAIASAGYPHTERSILARAAELSIPVTVHVAMGTDIIHMHPSADGAAIGRGSLYDFRLFAGMISDLDGGVYLNIGSAVILPEVFLKALSLARNLGHSIRDFTTVNMDFIKHYRAQTNVVNRPVRQHGKGYTLIGHHELMVPLLFAAVVDKLP